MSYLILYEVLVEAILAQPTVLIVVLAPTVVSVEPNLKVLTNILIPTAVLAAPRPFVPSIDELIATL